MENSDQKPIILIPKSDSISELQRFVSLFHQDFDLFEMDIVDAARGFFRSLSSEEKASLRRELQKLLEEYPGKKQKGLRKAWFRLGAEWWDKKRDLRVEIENWIKDLD